jgi:hypothetical protein
MNLYKAHVNLGGEAANQVPKTNLTAAEIVVLRTIHGLESVNDIEKTGAAKKTHTDAAERNRLQMIYGTALRKIEGVGSINGIFGVGGALPAEPPQVVYEQDDIYANTEIRPNTDVPVEQPTRKRGRPKKDPSDRPMESKAIDPPVQAPTPAPTFAADEFELPEAV